MSTDNQVVQDAYAAAHAEAVAYFESIADRIHDAKAPDDATTWSDVANMEQLVDQLREIADPERA
jgi:uncharacterized protein (DUF2342 family)